MDLRSALFIFILVAAETAYGSIFQNFPSVPYNYNGPVITGTQHLPPPPPPGSSVREGAPPPPPSTKVPSPPSTRIIESFHVKSDIRYRFATTQMVSVVRNTADQAQEISFDVTLPKEAFIVSFSMEIDGKVYDGEVKEKAEAKKEYQAAVDKGQSAGHVRQAPRHSNIFEVSVNVANGSAVNFTLTYQEMLKRKLGVYEQEIHVEPGQAVENFLVEIYIQENRPLTFVRTPALRTDSLISNEIEEENELTIMDRPSSQTAYIKYQPTLQQQGNEGMSARFVVQYDVEHGTKGDVLVVDGYFVHFFAPDLPSMPKDIIFVLDVSGSMYGKKIEQLQTAMLAILSDLSSEDRFNIITFSSDVDSWKPDLVDAQGSNMREAREFVKGMKADGMTNINNALLAGISKLREREDKQRVPMIFFLTDGVPTVGVQDPEKIAANVFDSNGNTAAIFGLAFGSGADFDSLKTICAQNSGFARKIYEASDAALQVSSFYQEISAVAMKDLSVQYLPSSVDEYTITETEFPVVFNGSEIMICGRMADEAETFELEIKGLQKSGDVSLVLEIDDMDNFILEDDDSLNPFFTMPRDFAGIVEKMWAYLTIKQLLLEKDKHVSDEVKAKELTDKILEMSLKYKFVTPLTSMVVTKPDSEDKFESGLEDLDDMPKDDVPWPVAHSYGQQGMPGLSPSSSNSYMLRSQPRQSNHGQRHHVRHHKSGHKIPAISYMPTATPLVYATLTNMPPMTTQTTTTKNGRRKPAKSGDVVLSSITSKSGNMSICLAPRKLRDGVYTIFETPDATVSLQTACADRACRNAAIKKISLTSGKDTAYLTIDSTTPEWMLGADSPLTATEVNANKVILAGAGIQINLGKKSKRKFDLMTVEIIVGSSDSISGLIGDLLSKPPKKLNKWRKRKVPGPCRRQKAFVSKSLNFKLARKYKQ